MNIKNWNGKRKVVAILTAVLLIIGLILTIYLVQTTLETRTRAEKATVLSLTPVSQTVQVNDPVDLDVNINPGVNQVNYVKMVINFDSTKFDSNNISFTLDSNTKFKRTAEDSISNGQIIITLDVGSSPIDVVRLPQKIGTLSLLVGAQNETQEKELISGETQVTFNEELTQVRSIGEADTYMENVLSGTTPASIIIEAVCRPDIATCTWDSVDGAASYNYVITNLDNEEVILEGSTSETSVEFAISTGIEYSCSVTATNDCGNTGEAGEDIVICEAPITPIPTDIPSGTSTPTPSPTITPTLIPSTTPTASPSLTPIPSLSLTSTLTPTPTLSLTPAPTDISSPTPTSVVYNESISYEASPTPAYLEEATPTPSMAPTGSPLIMIGGIIGGGLLLLGGVILLFF